MAIKVRLRRMLLTVAASGLALAVALLAVSPPVLAQRKPGVKALTPSPPPNGEGEGRMLISTELVSLTVTVTDSQGRHLPGLRREDFTVYDNGVAQELTHFSDADAPASIGIVFDTSGS